MKNSFFKELFSFLTSLKLTIVILIIIATTSIFGTIIPQNEAPHFYHKFYSPTIYTIIKTLKLDDMYHAWWFVATLSLFTLNLACCTCKRLPGFLRLMMQKEKQPDEKAIEVFPLKKTFHIKKSDDNTSKAFISGVQKNMSAPVVQQSESGAFSLFAEKGRYSRLSFYITHIGIILIIVGGILGNLGFQGFMKLVEGEASDKVVLRGSGEHIKLDFSIRCNDFEATYYQGSQRPKDYKSSLTVIEGGQEVLTKVIEVNDPLQYKGIYIYQSSYGTATGAGDVLLGVAPQSEPQKVTKYRIKIGEQAELENGYAVKIQRFVPDFTLGQNNQVISRSEQLRNPAVQIALLLDGNKLYEKWVFANFPDFHGAKEGAYRFTFEAFFGKEYTGLQLTRDPGVWVVWVGCFMLTLGCYLMFFMSHRRLWVKAEPEQDGLFVTVAGSADKHLQSFKGVFENIFQELKQAGKDK